MNLDVGMFRCPNTPSKFWHRLVRLAHECLIIKMMIVMINDDDDGGGSAVVVLMVRMMMRMMMMLMMILTVISRRSMQATSLSAPGHPRPPGFTFQIESFNLKVSS